MPKKSKKENEFSFHLFGPEDSFVLLYTYMGKLIMILTFVFLAAYLYHLNILMWGMDSDTFRTVTLLNTFDDGHVDESDAPSLPRENGQKSLLIEKNNLFYLNDLNLMPFFEIKFLKQFGPDDFDIFANSEEMKKQLEKGASAWDLSLSIDYEKLRKYIQF
jgi:hypothetical protein